MSNLFPRSYQASGDKLISMAILMGRLMNVKATGLKSTMHPNARIGDHGIQGIGMFIE